MKNAQSTEVPRPIASDWSAKRKLFLSYAGVSRWKIGQRVGVGLIAREDGVCESCRRGDSVN